MATFERGMDRQYSCVKKQRMELRGQRDVVPRHANSHGMLEKERKRFSMLEWSHCGECDLAGASSGFLTVASVLCR